eukprot:g8263.t1
MVGDVRVSLPLGGSLSSNEAFLLQLYGAAVVSFLLCFCLRACRTTKDADGEISLIRWCTRVLRAGVVVLVFAQLPLLQRAFTSSNPEGRHALIDGIARPLAVSLLSATGLVAYKLAALRLVFSLGMLLSVGVDTVSEVALDAELVCRDSPQASVAGRCDKLLGDLSDAQLWWLLVRDALCIWLGVWALLLCMYTWIAIGCGHTRYAPQQLSLRKYGKEKLPLWLVNHIDATAAQKHRR